MKHHTINTILIFAVTLILLVSNILWNKQRRLCNQTVLSDRVLEEDVSEPFFMSYIDIKPTLENLQETNNSLRHELSKTNKEFNKLRSIIGCYFDKP